MREQLVFIKTYIDDLDGIDIFSFNHMYKDTQEEALRDIQEHKNFLSFNEALEEAEEIDQMYQERQKKRTLKFNEDRKKEASKKTRQKAQEQFYELRF